ncbi:hypothetical protein EVAR_32162_1 [Eumeta japonica]|uniref:Uncharacterized protein n=1 Tax=Eumeta variegata TaxID=151549 RepID=A0A4C1VWG8_EUMVA|nr:hypothetical protein EVAR_32162_1 [Eumeta japonica]
MAQKNLALYNTWWGPRERQSPASGSAPVTTQRQVRQYKAKALWALLHKGTMALFAISEITPSAINRVGGRSCRGAAAATPSRARFPAVHNYVTGHNLPAVHGVRYAVALIATQLSATPRGSKGRKLIATSPIYIRNSERRAPRFGVEPRPARDGRSAPGGPRAYELSTHVSSRRQNKRVELYVGVRARRRAALLTDDHYKTIGTESRNILPPEAVAGRATHRLGRGHIARAADRPPTTAAPGPRPPARPRAAPPRSCPPRKGPARAGVIINNETHERSGGRARPAGGARRRARCRPGPRKPASLV